MGVSQVRLTPSLDYAAVTVALGDTGDINLFAYLKGICCNNVAYVHGSCAVKTELFKILFEGNFCFEEVSLRRLGKLSLCDVFIAELNCFVAVVFCGLLLCYSAGACSYNGYRNDITLLIEDLGHTDFLADDAFFHFYPP